jgi:hypothetical protein
LHGRTIRRVNPATIIILSPAPSKELLLLLFLLFLLLLLLLLFDPRRFRPVRRIREQFYG